MILLFITYLLGELLDKLENVPAEVRRTDATEAMNSKLIIGPEVRSRTALFGHDDIEFQ